MEVPIASRSDNTFFWRRVIPRQHPGKPKASALQLSTFACILHAIFPKTGTRLMNILGIFKIMLILVIIFAGFAALGGHLKIPKPNNFSSSL